MIIESKNQCRLRPIRHVLQTKLLRHLRRPNIERIRDQATRRRRRPRPHYLRHRSLRVGREHVQKGGHELVVVERPVELHRQAIAQGGVADVEARVADGGKDVGGRGGCGDLAVDEVGVDECDGEAS